MEAASRSESVEACTGRNFNGTFMIIRRAERRSGAGMVFLLDPGGHQVEIREGTRSVSRIGVGRVKHYFIFRTMILGDKCRRSSTKRGEGLWEHGAGFRADRDVSTSRAKRRGLCQTRRRCWLAKRRRPNLAS